MVSYFKNKWTKFVKWMTYDPPNAASAEDWKKFDQTFKTSAPIRWFIVDKLPELFWPILFWWRRIRNFFRYRFVPSRRYHVVKTGLKPDYYEPEVRMLHANFNILVDFVEKEKAALSIWTSAEPKPKGWWWKKYTDWRLPEYGMRYLEWETSLDDDQWDGESHMTQAQAAREIIILYKWWKEVCLPWEEPEYPEIPDEKDETKEWSDFLSQKFDRSAPEWVTWQKECDEVEQKIEDFRKEETEMLIRLIRIRSRLWT